MGKAVLVMDMQNVCVGENHYKLFTYDTSKLIDSVNEVITKNEGSAIIYIQNIMKDNFINKLAPVKAYDGSEEVELVKSMRIVSDYIYKKYSGDAFTNPELKTKLNELNIKQVEIVGIDGGGCVALTALGAIKAGYKVILNTKAIGTMFIKKAEKYNKKLRKLGAEFI
jgi:nicotinamidase-related amidase